MDEGEFLAVRTNDKRMGLRFSLVFAAAVTLTLCLLSAVNWLVNPLYLYRDGQTAAANGIRAEFGYNSRIAKPHIISARQPSSLILGSSRSEFGYAPEHPIFGQNGFNSGYSGGTANEAVHTLAHAVTASRPTLVLWSLDPRLLIGKMPREQAAGLKKETLLEFETPVPSKSVLAKLAKDGNGNGGLLGHDLQKLTLISSMYQLKMSLNVLLGPATYAGKGFLYRVTGQRDRDFNNYWVDTKGQRNMALPYLKGLAKTVYNEPRDGISFRTLSLVEKAEKIVSDAKNTRLIVVLEPVHVAVYAAGDKLSEYDTITENIPVLVRLLDQHGYKAEIWDCSLLNEYTTEAIPAKGSPEKMLWWWETNHFKHELGMKMLDVIQVENQDSDVCRPVRPDNAAAHVEYRKAHKSALFSAGYPVLAEMFKKDAFWQAK